MVSVVVNKVSDPWHQFEGWGGMGRDGEVWGGVGRGGEGVVFTSQSPRFR